MVFPRHSISAGEQFVVGRRFEGVLEFGERLDPNGSDLVAPHVQCEDPCRWRVPQRRECLGPGILHLGQKRGFGVRIAPETLIVINSEASQQE